jgi:hypothetical protein
MRAIPGGTVGGSGFGRPARIRSRVAAIDGAEKGALPASISCSVAPTAHRSVRASTGSPRSCSGARYPTVPTSTALLVRLDSPSGAPVMIFARPKSSSFTCPSAVTITLAGFTSRWTIPNRCAVASALTTARAIATASCGGSAPARAIFCLTVSPS